MMQWYYTLVFLCPAGAAFVFSSEHHSEYMGPTEFSRLVEHGSRPFVVERVAPIRHISSRL